MGLKLKLKPFEKFIVNGVVIENGRHRNTVTVANHAQVMTGRSIMQLEEANTPAKRTYFVIQCMLIDPPRMAEHRRNYEALMQQLRAALVDPDMSGHLAEAAAHVRDGDHYKALAALRPVIAYEADLLGEDPADTVPAMAEAVVRD